MSEILKSGSVDGVMGFLTAYQDKMSHLDEQWRMHDREKTTLTEQLNVLRKNAQDLNPTTVKDAKTNRYITAKVLFLFGRVYLIVIIQTVGNFIG